MVNATVMFPLFDVHLAHHTIDVRIVEMIQIILDDFFILFIYLLIESYFLAFHPIPPA